MGREWQVQSTGWLQPSDQHGALVSPSKMGLPQLMCSCTSMHLHTGTQQHTHKDTSVRVTRLQGQKVEDATFFVRVSGSS